MGATDMLRGRQTATRTLTNKSGGAVALGDVVVVGDAATDNAFTTTTTASFNARMVGVAMEAIANNAAGLVAISGYVPIVNSAVGGLTREHFLFASTVAKEATGSATRAAGAFGQVLETGVDPEAFIWGMPDASSAGGAPTDAQYLVGALNGSLSAEKVKAALWKNYDPDEYPTSGTTFTDEFDDSSLDAAWTWDTAPGGTVSETEYPGFLYLTGGTDATPAIRLLRRTFAPGAAAFSVVTKINHGIENGNYGGAVGIRLVDSADATIWSIVIATDGSATGSDGYRIISTASTWITAATTPMIGAPQYFLITRSAANVYKGYISSNGIAWQYIGTSTVATTVAKVAIVYQVDTDALDDDTTIDFVRVFTTETKKIGA